jgi:hypothetical protein
MAGTMTLIAPAIAAGLAFWPSPFLAVPFYSCCRLGASKERPLECSVIGGIAPRGFSAASDSLSFFCAWRCGLCGKS